jgi:hypothetical protein
MRNFLKIIALAALEVGLMTPVYAQETTSYAYDALGRLVLVTHSGSANDGTSTTYTYDAAGNRKSLVVATSASGGSGGGDGSGNPGSGSNANTLYVVVPLNGYTIIPVPNPGGIHVLVARGQPTQLK